MALSEAITFLGLLAYFSVATALFSGFPKERCDDMDPTKIAIVPPTADIANTSDYTLEDPLPTALVISGSLNLFRLVASSPKYRRGRVMDITIKGPAFNAFMLQVRKIGPDERRGVDKPVRVGDFVSWPPAAIQSVNCDQGRVTSLTNKNFSPKEEITVKWKAPKEDVGDVHIVGRFIAGDEYWQLSESRELQISEFPVNLAKCGKAKSCILYSEKSDSCHEDNCDYILTYHVVNNSFVEFVLGGNIKGENTYLAVGFSKDAQAEKMNMVACTRAKTAAEIKYFVLTTPEDGFVEHTMSLENRKMDLDGDRMWCSFTVPLSGPPEDTEGLDLRVPLYHVYARGKTNHTKMGNTPILPSNLLISKNEVRVEKIKLQYHTMEKLKSSASLPRLDCLFALLYLFLRF